MTALFSRRAGFGAALFAALFAFGLAACSEDASDTEASATEVETGQTPAVDGAALDALRAKGYLLGDVSSGDAAAPVTVYEYASLTCPHCRTFHIGVLPTLKTDYVESGKARFVLREVIWDRLGLYAVALMRCSGRERAYFALADTLFEKQTEWNLGRDAQAEAAGVQVMKRYGKLAGLSDERIDQCLTDQAFLEHLFDTSAAAAQAAGVEATPSLVINGELLRGVPDLDTLRATLDAAAQ